jgi:hypothetical protein
MNYACWFGIVLAVVELTPGEQDNLDAYVCWFGFVLAVISLLGLGASGPGHRLGLWGFQTGLGVAKYSAYLSLAAVVVCSVGLGLWISTFGSGGPTPALFGLVVGGFVSVWMLWWKHNLDG